MKYLMACVLLAVASQGAVAESFLDKVKAIEAENAKAKAAKAALPGNKCGCTSPADCACADACNCPNCASKAAAKWKTGDRNFYRDKWWTLCDDGWWRDDAELRRWQAEKSGQTTTYQPVTYSLPTAPTIFAGRCST